jgi:Putative adhesin
MKRVLIIVVLLAAAAMLGMWRTQGGVRQGLDRIVGVSDDDSPGVTGDETRKNFELQPGARIEVQGINGKVEIQTSDTKTAEVYVRRTADSPSSLRRREMIIEQTSDGLMVRSRQTHVGFWAHLFGHDPTEEVTIKAPRQIALSFRSINGRVTSSDIDGYLEAKGINGRVELGLIRESVDLSAINGNITVGLTELGARGARLSAINGNIELRLASNVNADLTAKAMNGNVRSDIPDVNVDREERGSRFSARIGNGGVPISISAINGNVRLTRPDNPAASSTSNSKDKAAAASTTQDKQSSAVKGANTGGR